MRARRTQVRPCGEAFEVAPAPFGDNLDLASREISDPSVESKRARFVLRRRPKENALHASAHDKTEPRTIIGGTHRGVSLSRRAANDFSSRTLTPSSFAFFSLEPGSAPTTRKSVLRLTDPVTRP